MLFYTCSEHYTKAMIILKFQVVFSLIFSHWTKAFTSISHEVFLNLFEAYAFSEKPVDLFV